MKIYVQNLCHLSSPSHMSNPLFNPPFVNTSNEDKTIWQSNVQDQTKDENLSAFYFIFKFKASKVQWFVYEKDIKICCLLSQPPPPLMSHIFGSIWAAKQSDSISSSSSINCCIVKQIHDWIQIVMLLLAHTQTPLLFTGDS